jgi:hypothetical protein
MNNENDRLDGVDNLESLIDRALESYTPCAPRPGLEQRVLASLDAENHPRPRFWSWRLTWVFSAGVLLLAAVAIPGWIASRQPRITALRRAPVSQVEHSPQPTPAVASSTKKMRRTLTATQPAPQPQFGQPRATKEELLLARSAAQYPELLSALNEEKSAIDTPISIPAIFYNPIAAKPVDIPPISVAPIQISSLNSPN